MVNPRYASHTLGTGPIIIDLWLDYICPFSKKQFNAIYKLIQPTVEKQFPNKFTFVFNHQPQPWHGQGSYLHEAGLAVGLIAPNKFWEFSSELYSVSENFYDTNSYTKSRKQIVEELAQIAKKVGVDEQKFVSLVSIDLNSEFKNPGPKVVNDVKYFVKLGRQNGVHVSPTVAINGLLVNSVSSSWTADQWVELLSSVLTSADTKL